MKQQVKSRQWLLLMLAAVVLVGAELLLGGFAAVQRLIYPQKYEEYVVYYAQKYGIDEKIVYSIIRTESGFDPRAQSKVDARGLMQITEDTFLWIKSKIAPQEAISFEHLYDPETNIRFGCYLLAVCLQRYGGDLSTAAAAYHSGLAKVDSLLGQAQYSADGVRLSEFPYRQMNHYVNKVNRNYRAYQALYGMPGSVGIV